MPVRAAVNHAVAVCDADIFSVSQRFEVAQSVPDCVPVDDNVPFPVRDPVAVTVSLCNSLRHSERQCDDDDDGIVDRNTIVDALPVSHGLFHAIVICNAVRHAVTF